MRWNAGEMFFLSFSCAHDRIGVQQQRRRHQQRRIRSVEKLLVPLRLLRSRISYAPGDKRTERYKKRRNVCLFFFILRLERMRKTKEKGSTANRKKKRPHWLYASELIYNSNTWLQRPALEKTQAPHWVSFFFFYNNKIDRNVFCGWLVFGTGARKSRSQRSHTHTHALADCAKTLHETITCV